MLRSQCARHLSILKMAGFEAPFGGWFWAPNDTLKVSAPIGHLLPRIGGEGTLGSGESAGLGESGCEWTVHFGFQS